MWVRFFKEFTAPGGSIYPVGVQHVHAADAVAVETMAVGLTAELVFDEHSFVSGNPHGTAIGDVSGLNTRLTTVEVAAASGVSKGDAAQSTANAKENPLTFNAPLSRTNNVVSLGINYFNAAGAFPVPTKKWIALVTPTTGNGYSIDISSAGFSSIVNVQVIAVKNTATVTSAPNVSIKTVSTSAIVVNITEGSTNLVTLLSTSVLSGLPVIFANMSGLTLYVEVTGS